jgi:PAS domain S-box-containing protein
MRPAPTDTVLLIESAEQAAAVMEQISDPARAAGLEVHSSPEEGAIERLKQMVAEGREPVGVVLGPNTKRPLVIARQVYQLTPFVQIIFLAAPGRAAQLQHEMLPTPMIGSNWTVASPDPDALRGLLRDAAASTRQRRQLRTTLHRVNVHVSSRLSADSGEYRKLVISDRYLASILTHAQDAIISTDAHGAVLTWNRAAERLFGYPESEMVGQSIKMLAADQRAYDLPALIRATQGGEAVVRYEIRCRRADGSSVEVEMTFAPVRDDVGLKIGASVIARDITERRRAEEVLQEMNVALVNAMPGISRVDPEGRYVSVNEVYAHMIGYKPADLIGMDWAPTVHPDDRGNAITAYHHMLSEGKAEFEARAVRKDGSVFHKHVLMVKRVDKEGSFIGHHCFMRDITERERAEEIRKGLYRASLAIQEPLRLKDRLDRLLQTAKEVLDLDRVNILLADPEGRLLAGVASLGTEEPLEEIWVPIGPEGGTIAHAYLTKRAVFWDGVAPVPEELRLKPPYDQIKALRSRVFANVPLVVQGRAIGVLGADRKHSRRPFEPAMRELLQLFASQAALAIEHARLYEDLQSEVQERTRELRAANLELERASRFKSEFLANMSHELRTPLNSILGFAELLEDQQFGPMNERQLRYVHNIWTSGRHLLDLINDILDLSKIEAGKMEIAPQSFALAEGLSAVVAMVRLAATRKQISLTCEIAPQVTTVTADSLRFKQIMYNLLSNAIKFTNGGGRVMVAARVVDGAFVEIAVTDTGIGIRAEDIPKLFQEFTQLDSFLGKQHEGTGLGLALTKRLVELHGGKIWAESLGPGQGATFTFTLPITGPSSSVTS